MNNLILILKMLRNQQIFTIKWQSYVLDTSSRIGRFIKMYWFMNELTWSEFTIGFVIVMLLNNIFVENQFYFQFTFYTKKVELK